MIMPNFLIVGAGKAGTTALYHYLRQHPQIYLSRVKETNFFALEGEQVAFKGPDAECTCGINRHSINNLNDYQQQFQTVSTQLAIGEVSPLYLYRSQTAAKIRYYIPDVKLVVILRNPVERAYSSFLHMIRDGWEPIWDFSVALEAETARIKHNWGWIWHYQNLGFYYSQLVPYFELFEPQQIKVYLYDDFNANPLKILRDLFQFLGVDETFVPDISLKHNVSGIPKNPIFNTFLNQAKWQLKKSKTTSSEKILRFIIQMQNQNLCKPPLSDTVRQQLLQIYQDDILKLEKLIQQDLSDWLTTKNSTKSAKLLALDRPI